MKQSLKLQRRHFEFIAEQIKGSMPDGPDKMYIIGWWTGALDRTNGQFDAGRFSEACLRNPSPKPVKPKPVKPKKVKEFPEGALSLKEIHQAKRMVDHA